VTIGLYRQSRRSILWLDVLLWKFARPGLNLCPIRIGQLYLECLTDTPTL
jgi:hypothetical protein